MFDYIRDTINPRGPEYGATARAASAAQRNADATEDMLALNMAQTSAERARVAMAISERRRRKARAIAFRDKLQLAFVFLVIAGSVWLFTDHGEAPQSAVTHDTPAHVSQAPRVSHAPAIPVAAPGAIDSSKLVDVTRLNRDYDIMDGLERGHLSRNEMHFACEQALQTARGWAKVASDADGQPSAVPADDCQ